MGYLGTCIYHFTSRLAQDSEFGIAVKRTVDFMASSLIVQRMKGREKKPPCPGQPCLVHFFQYGFPDTCLITDASLTVEESLTSSRRRSEVAPLVVYRVVIYHLIKLYVRGLRLSLLWPIVLILVPAKT